MSALHRVVSQHAHDHKLLDLCSGLQRTIERFDALLAAHVTSDGPPLDCELVHVVLGAIAIRNRLSSAFDVEPAIAEPVRPDAARMESLLR